MSTKLSFDSRMSAAALALIVTLGLVLSAATGPSAASPRHAESQPSSASSSPNDAVAARASSSNDSAHGAGRAIDGDLSTGWQARGARGWVETDLGGLKSVTSVEQTFAQQAVWKFTIQGSVDGHHWATLVDRSAGASGQTFSNDVNGVWRYLRLVVTGSSSGAVASSQEFSAQANGDGSDLAVGKAVTASSGAGDYLPGKAVDGDTSTYWGATSPSMPQWLQVDLGTPSALTRVVQNFKDDDTYKFAIDASLDGSTWTTLLDASTGAVGEQFSQHVSGIYRYVRLTITGSASGYSAGSTEFGVYGSDNRALDAGATASSQAAGHAAHSAVDGDTSSYWLAASRSAHPSLTVDLGGLTLLTRVEQTFAERARWRFAVLGSVHGRHWTQLLTNSTGTTGTSFTHEVTGAYRYLRLTVDPGRHGPAPSSRELAAYGTPITRNLALGVSATTSSLAKGHEQSKALDGNASTYWNAGPEGATGTRQWLTLDLGNDSLISGVRQQFATSGNWSFTIEASPDKTHWRTLLNHRSGRPGQTFSKDVHGTYRYIRLTVHAGPAPASSEELTVTGIGSPITDKWWEDTSGVRKYYINYYHDTLKSIQAQLDTLKSDGYGAIEVTGLPEGWPQPFAGLAALNEYKVDPHAGTMADFLNLIAAAHARGIRVMFFGNLGYSSDHAPFFIQAAKDYRNNVDSPEVSWFMFDHASTPEACKQVSAEHAGDHWFWSDAAQVCYYAQWGAGAPAFNFTSASWRAEAGKYLDYWMNTGIDAMTLDAPYVYLEQPPGQPQALITTPVNNAAITDVLERYDTYSRPEGGACCGYSFLDPIVNRNYSAVQWYPDASVLTSHNPSGLEDFAKNNRDTVVNVHGVQTEPPSWDYNTGISPEQRLLEIANITTTGSMVYLDENFSDLTYLPQRDIIPKWPVAAQTKLWQLMRAQNSYQALAPVGSRFKVPTNDDNKYYAYVRTSKQGGVKALTILNYQSSPQKIAVNLSGTGIGTHQTPVDLVTGGAAPPISSGTYTITLPAYGFAVLGVAAGASAPASAEAPVVGPVDPSPVLASRGEPVTVSTTVTNPGTATATNVSAQLQVPDGWTATPVDAPTTINGGTTAKFSWRLEGLSSTAPGAYQATLPVSYEADGVVWIAKPVTIPLYLDAAPIFTIGTFDGSDSEFALAPGSFGQYPTAFPHDVSYTVGISTPDHDWSYIQPGPADPWAGSRPHTFTIHYSLPSAPTGDFVLTLGYVDTQAPIPPRVQVSSNGTVVQTLDLPPGGGGGAFGTSPEKSYETKVVLPQSAVHAGDNTIAIANISNSWSVYDAVRLVETRP